MKRSRVVAPPAPIMLTVWSLQCAWMSAVWWSFLPCHVIWEENMCASVRLPRKMIRKQWRPLQTENNVWNTTCRLLVEDPGNMCVFHWKIISLCAACQFWVPTWKFVVTKWRLFPKLCGPKHLEGNIKFYQKINSLEKAAFETLKGSRPNWRLFLLNLFYFKLIPCFYKDKESWITVQLTMLTTAIQIKNPVKVLAFLSRSKISLSVPVLYNTQKISPAKKTQNLSKEQVLHNL